MVSEYKPVPDMDYLQVCCSYTKAKSEHAFESLDQFVGGVDSLNSVNCYLGYLFTLGAHIVLTVYFQFSFKQSTFIV